MFRPLSLLTRAVALSVTVGVGAATAQTVVVRNARPGAKIELQVNTEGVTSATADADGDAVLAVTLAAGTSQIDVRTYVDVCDALVRVLFVSPGLQPRPSTAGCNRNEIYGVFITRPITTFVVDIEGTNATLHLRQGAAPVAWTGRSVGSEHTRRFFRATPPTGLVLFGGAGLLTFSDATQAVCGNVTTCLADSFTGAASVGVEYWFGRFLGVHASFAKAAHMNTDGSGAGFRFNSALGTRLGTLAGMAGVPIGPVRVYGLAGGNYHRATSATTETIDDVTVVIDTVSQTFKGGTQTFNATTEGGGWLFGGGIEAWVTRSFAIYGEGQRARLKGSTVAGGDGAINDHVTVLIVGARVRLGR